MAEINRDLKQSYIAGGISVIVFITAVTIFAKTDIDPLLWLSALFILFLSLSYAAIYKPKITCGHCSTNLYKAEELAFKKTKVQNALQQCPNCGATFDYPESVT